MSRCEMSRAASSARVPATWPIASTTLRSSAGRPSGLRTSLSFMASGMTNHCGGFCGSASSTGTIPTTWSRVSCCIRRASSWKRCCVVVPTLPPLPCRGDFSTPRVPSSCRTKWTCLKDFTAPISRQDPHERGAVADMSGNVEHQNHRPCPLLPITAPTVQSRPASAVPLRSGKSRSRSGVHQPGEPGAQTRRAPIMPLCLAVASSWRPMSVSHPARCRR